MGPPVEPPPRSPDRQAKDYRVDSDRDRAEQSRHQRRRHRDDAEYNPRRPGGAAVTQPPQPPASERQGEAARRDRHKRHHQHQQSREPCRGLRADPWPEPRHSGHGHPGRQPQERRRPEAAPLDTSAIVHTSSDPNPGPGASPDAVRERYSSAVNLPGRGREKRGAGQMPGRERETVSRSRRRGRYPERRLDNV